MKKILSILLILVLSISVFTGCGKTENKVEEKEVAKTEEVAEKEEEVAEEETVEAEEELGWPRTLTDARGVEVTFEKKPERIAVTTWNITENLLALDSPPVASDTVEIMSKWESMKEYFKKYKVEDLGIPINFEKLAEIKPDLILSSTWNEDDYDKLEKIAPIFVIEGQALFDDWKSSMREIAKVLDKEEVSEKFIADTKSEIEQIRKNLASINENVGFISHYNGIFATMNSEQLATYYDNETGLGLKLPEGWAKETGPTSLEVLSEIDPDILFVRYLNFDEFKAETDGNSVWNSLSAVKNGKVYHIDLSGLTGGPLAITYGIKVVKEALIK